MVVVQIGMVLKEDFHTAMNGIVPSKWLSQKLPARKSLENLHLKYFGELWLEFEINAVKDRLRIGDHLAEQHFPPCP
jgi:hypothetical protein